MVGQGDYYSALFLKVLNFKITRDYKEVPSECKKGILWMDYTLASYDDRASDMLKGCKWQFFTVQLSEGDYMLLLNTETNTTGALPITRLYSKKDKTLNGTINATYSWNIDKISILPDEDPQYKWTSPGSGVTYNMKYNIELKSSNKKMNANFTITKEKLRDLCSRTKSGIRGSRYRFRQTWFKKN